MICPKCGKEFDPYLRPTELCEDCRGKTDAGEQREFFEQSPRSGSSYAGFKGYCPWEDEEGLGFTRGLIETFKQSLFDSTNFFRRLPLHGGYKLPFLYALVISSVSIVIGYTFSVMTNSTAIPMMMPEGMMVGSKLGSLIYMLLMLILGIFLHPLLLFLCLMVLGVRSASLESTFRISCYCFGPEIFRSIPFVGWLIAGIWQFVILVIGLREGFRIGTGRAVISIMLPLIVVLSVVVIILMVVVGKLMAFHALLL